MQCGGNNHKARDLHEAGLLRREGDNRILFHSRKKNGIGPLCAELRLMPHRRLLRNRRSEAHQHAARAPLAQPPLALICSVTQRALAVAGKIRKNLGGPQEKKSGGKTYLRGRHLLRERQKKPEDPRDAPFFLLLAGQAVQNLLGLGHLRHQSVGALQSVNCQQSGALLQNDALLQSGVLLPTEGHPWGLGDHVLGLCLLIPKLPERWAQ